MVGNMDNLKFDIRFVDNWMQNDIVKLYKSAGWWKESYNPAEINDLIKGSFAFVVVINTETNETIGMGRILSDGVSDAYIQDLVILPQYREIGIGKKLVKFLLDYCISKKISWIGLIAEPKQDPFYLSLGFKPLVDYIPMKYSMEI